MLDNASPGISGSGKLWRAPPGLFRSTNACGKQVNALRTPVRRYSSSAISAYCEISGLIRQSGISALENRG
jgi:hypothetical protein